MHIWTNMFQRGWFNHQLPGFYVFQQFQRKERPPKFTSFSWFSMSPTKKAVKSVGTSEHVGCFYLFVPFKRRDEE